MQHVENPLCISDGETGSERLKDLSKVTQLVRTKPWAHAFTYSQNFTYSSLLKSLW